MSLEESREAAKKAWELEKEIENYHPSLVLQMDETMAPWCPTDNSTYAPKGSSTVRIIGASDKRGNTVTLTETRNCNLLPPQIIWEGKTERCIPNYHWPEDADQAHPNLSSLTNGRTKRQWPNILIRLLDLIFKWQGRISMVTCFQCRVER